MSTAALNGRTAMRVRAHRPAWGLPWFDVELEGEHTLEGAVELTLADATFACAVVSGGPWLGRSSYRLVGGAGGWARALPAKEYRNDGGVKLSKVLADAAREAGETVDALPSGTVGPSWDRMAGAAADTLQLLTPRAWRVDADGVTRFGEPPATTLEGAAARGRVDLAAGYIELATESIASIAPGIVVDGLRAVDVVHTIEGAKLRTTLWGASGRVSKRLDAYQAIVERLFPGLRYAGTWEYRIVSQTGDRLNLQPSRASLPVPDLRGVQVRGGVPGLKCTPKLGALVLVVFANSDPAQPRVVSFDDATPSELLLGAGSGRVLREGDTLSLTGVQPGAGPAAGVVATVTLGLGVPPLPSKVKA